MENGGKEGLILMVGLASRKKCQEGGGQGPRNPKGEEMLPGKAIPRKSEATLSLEVQTIA